MFKLNKKPKEGLQIEQVLNESVQDAQEYKTNGVLSEEVRAAISRVSSQYIDEMANRVDAELNAALAPTFKEDMNQVKDILTSINECKRGLKQCDIDSQVEHISSNDLKLINIQRAKLEDQKAVLEVQLLEAITHAEDTTLISESVGKIADLSNTAFDSTLCSIDSTISTLQVQLLALEELRTRIHEAKGTLINKCLENYMDIPVRDLDFHKALTTNQPLVKTTFKL